MAIPFYIKHHFELDEIGCTRNCLMVKDLRNPRTDEEQLVEDVDMVEHGGRINKTKRKHKTKSRRTNKRTKSKRKTKGRK